MNKRIRKKQIRRAAARQCGGGKGFSCNLSSSGDYKRPLIERWEKYAKTITRLGEVSIDRIIPR